MKDTRFSDDIRVVITDDDLRPDIFQSSQIRRDTFDLPPFTSATGAHWIFSDLINTRFFQITEETEQALASSICENAIRLAKKYIRDKDKPADANDESAATTEGPDVPRGALGDPNTLGVIQPSQLKRDTFTMVKSSNYDRTEFQPTLVPHNSFTTRPTDPLPPIVRKSESANTSGLTSIKITEETEPVLPSTTSDNAITLAKEYMHINRGRDPLPPIVKGSDSPNRWMTSDLINSFTHVTDETEIALGQSISEEALSRALGHMPARPDEDDSWPLTSHLLNASPSSTDRLWKVARELSVAITEDKRISVPLKRKSSHIDVVKKVQITPPKVTDIKDRPRPAPFQMHYTRETYRPYPNVRHLPRITRNQQGVASVKQAVKKSSKETSEFQNMVCPRAPNFRPNQLMVNSNYVLNRYYNSTDCSQINTWTPLAGKRRHTYTPVPDKH